MNKNYPHPIIAKEGWLYIVICILISLTIEHVSNFWCALPFWLITLFVIQFFRDPARIIDSNSNNIVAPADGKIIVIEDTIDPYLKTNAKKISIFMNVFNVHSNRYPVDGTVINIFYTAGKFLNASVDKASSDNERNAIIIKMNNDTKITVIQIAGLIARRIMCYAKVGDNATRGSRYGFIKFGSRVDIYLPINTKLLVSIGQKVYASETVLATFEG
jgi:phosphatidylserine decarboxylase